MLLSLEQFWLSGWDPSLTIGLSDVLGVTDSYALDLTARLVDGVDVDETALMAFTSRVDDTTLLSDIFARTWDASAGLSSTLPLQDATSRSTAVPQSDAVSAADLFSQSFARGVSSQVSLSDSADSLWSVSRALAEAILMTRSVVRDVTFLLADTPVVSDVLRKSYGTAFSDGVGPADAFGPKASGLRAFDGVESVEVLAAATAFYRGIAQSIGVTTAEQFGLVVPVADSLPVSDALLAVLYQQFFTTLSSEVAVLSESVFSLTSSLADYLGVILDRRLELARGISDSLSATDVSNAVMGMQRAHQDLLEVADVLDYAVDWAENLNVWLEDTLTVADDLAKAVSRLEESSIMLTDSPLASWLLTLGYERSLYRAGLVVLRPTVTADMVRPTTSVEPRVPSTSIDPQLYDAHPAAFVPEVRLSVL